MRQQPLTAMLSPSFKGSRAGSSGQTIVSRRPSRSSLDVLDAAQPFDQSREHLAILRRRAVGLPSCRYAKPSAVTSTMVAR